MISTPFLGRSLRSGSDSLRFTIKTWNCSLFYYHLQLLNTFEYLMLQHEKRKPFSRQQFPSKEVVSHTRVVEYLVIKMMREKGSDRINRRSASKGEILSQAWISLRNRMSLQREIYAQDGPPDSSILFLIHDLLHHHRQKEWMNERIKK